MTIWQRTDVLLVLGAGASQGAGILPYREWRARVDKDRFPMLWEVWNRGFFHLELEDLIDAANLAHDIQVYPHAIVPPEPGEKAGPGFTDWKFMRDFDPIAFGAEVRGFIAEQVDPARVTDEYKQLAGQLRSLVIDGDQRVTVVSTNWDCLLESALQESSGYREMGLDAFMGDHGDSHLEVRVCKPHGSLGVAVDADGATRAVPVHHWKTLTSWENEQPLVSTPGATKRADMAQASPDYMKRAWAGTADAFATAGCIISIGFAWTPTDRDLRLLATRYPGREQTVRLYNQDDARAAKCASEALPGVRDAEAIDTGHSMKDAVVERIDKVAVDMLFNSHHLSAVTPNTMQWVGQEFPDLVEKHPVAFVEEPPGA